MISMPSRTVGYNFNGSDSISVDQFAQAFFSALSINGLDEINLASPKDIRKIERLRLFFACLIDDMKAGGVKGKIYYDILRLRNQMSPSESGTYDGFEDFVSSQQTWLTSRQNPTLDKVKLGIDPVFAEHVLSKQEAVVREFIQDAANEFLD